MDALYGLLGRALSHSISPVIHRAIFDILGVSADYKLFEVEADGLQEAVMGLKLNNTVGVNVTIPYKSAVMQYLDTISKEAASIGAVNTIAFKDRTAVGYNTDYSGFGMLLERYLVQIGGKQALVLGYGGASKAVVRYLLDHGIGRITIAVRSINNNALFYMPEDAEKITFVEYEQLKQNRDGDIIINCTPCGMYPDTGHSPAPLEVIRMYGTAIDLIYNPLETLFLGYARVAGLKTVNGLYMLVAQAVAAQEIWNGNPFSLREIDELYDTVAAYMLSKKA